MIPNGDGLEFFLYSSRPVKESFDGELRIRECRGIEGTVGSYWLQQICPHWMSKDGIAVFWGQNYMLPLRLRRPCRRVLTLHDITGLLMPWTMPLQRRLNYRLHQQRAARASDCLVAVSQATSHLAEVCLGIPSHKLRVVLEGCDTRLAVPPHGFVDPGTAARARDLVRERFGLVPGYLLAVGTLEPRKDYGVLFRAVRSLRNAPTLVVVGGVGWRCRKILRELNALQAAGLAQHLGRVDDGELAALYRAAGLCINSSLYEGFGLPVVEAMACGCPVVCSWTSSLPEVGGDAARYFRPGDSAHLTRVLEGVLGNPEELQAMRAAGLRRAKLFSFERAADEMLEILREQGRNMRGC